MKTGERDKPIKTVDSITFDKTVSDLQQHSSLESLF